MRNFYLILKNILSMWNILMIIFVLLAAIAGSLYAYMQVNP